MYMIEAAPPLSVIANLRHGLPLSFYVVSSPLSVACRVAVLVAIAIEEVDDEGARCTGERIPTIPIPGVPPSHRRTLIVVLANLRGRRRATTGRPRTKNHGLSKEEAGRSSANGAPGLI